MQTFNQNPSEESNQNSEEQNQEKSCLPKVLLFILIIAIAFFAITKISGKDFSSCKETVEKATSREIRNSDISVDMNYSSLTNLKLTVTAHNDVRDLTLKIEYVDSNKNVLKTTYANLGNINKGETKTQSYSLSDFSWSQLLKIDGCRFTIESGYVPLL